MRFSKDHLADGELEDTPNYAFLRGRNPRKTEITTAKEMAQAQVRIEFIDGKVNEKMLAIELYNMYFDGGMSGLVPGATKHARLLRARYITGLQMKKTLWLG